MREREREREIGDIGENRRAGGYRVLEFGRV